MKTFRSARNQLVQQLTAKMVARVSKAIEVKVEKWVEENGDELIESALQLIRR